MQKDSLRVRDTAEMSPAIYEDKYHSMALESKMTCCICQSLELPRWLLLLFEKSLEGENLESTVHNHSIYCFILCHDDDRQTNLLS